MHQMDHIGDCQIGQNLIRSGEDSIVKKIAADW